MKSIGWTNINLADGKPYRQLRSPDAWYGRKEPIKVYASEKRAKAYALEGFATVEVFIKGPTSEAVR